VRGAPVPAAEHGTSIDARHNFDARFEPAMDGGPKSLVRRAVQASSLTGAQSAPDTLAVAVAVAVIVA